MGEYTAAEFITDMEEAIIKADISETNRKVLLRDMVDIIDKINEGEESNISVIFNNHAADFSLSVRSATYDRSYYSNGVMESEEFYSNNELHRDNDKPAAVLYYPNGDKSEERWVVKGLTLTVVRDYRVENQIT